MNVYVWIKYEESYLPPRCRKLRYRECEEHVALTLPEASMSDLRLAFEDSSYEGAGKIYSYSGDLWRLATKQDCFCSSFFNKETEKETTPLDNLVNTMNRCSCHFLFAYDREVYGVDTSRAGAIKKAKDSLSPFLLVDGELYIRTAEPRYCIYTFGLGHNHGGSALSVDYHYNTNISQDRYFSALRGDEAVVEAARIALDRGDTESVARLKAEITVYAPDLVKINPQKQHGEGNPVLNKLEAITEAAPDALTAGLFCIAATM